MVYCLRLFFFCLTLLSISACTDHSSPKHVLPFFGNYEIVTSETDGIIAVDTIYPTIPTFEFLNQDSVSISSKSLHGKVWIANFFFTSCPSICPPMMEQLKRVHKLTEDVSKQVQFLSFSIDPSHDSPSILKHYAEQRGMKADNWTFFTGNEAKIHKLGVEHFLVHAARDQYEAGGFAHSDALVLVDKEGHVRGVYQSGDKTQVEQLIKDTHKLITVEYGNHK